MVFFYMAVMMMLVVLMKMNISGYVATRQYDHDCDEQLKKGDLSCAMRRDIIRKPKSKVHCPHDQHDDHADKPM